MIASVVSIVGFISKSFCNIKRVVNENNIIVLSAGT